MAEMTREQVLNIKALAERATKGPWTGIKSKYVGCFFVLPNGFSEVEPICKLSLSNADNNAFIAASRTAVPALCDEVLRLSDQIDHGKAVLDEYKTKINRLRAELEAAIAILKTQCGACKHKGEINGACSDCWLRITPGKREEAHRTKWEWRGPQEGANQ